MVQKPVVTGIHHEKAKFATFQFRVHHDKAKFATFQFRVHHEKAKFATFQFRVHHALVSNYASEPSEAIRGLDRLGCMYM